MTEEQIAILASKAAIEHLEAERKKQQKSKRDRRLRNTKLLLKHYRNLKEHCDDNLKLRFDEDVITDIDDQYLAINSITRSKKRTQQMVKFIDHMLEIYRIRSEQSEDPLDLRQYKTMKSLYISKEVLTVEEIAKAHKVDARTVYRDSKDAVYQLSCLIFGIDGLRMID